MIRREKDKGRRVLQSHGQRVYSHGTMRQPGILLWSCTLQAKAIAAMTLGVVYRNSSIELDIVKLNLLVYSIRRSHFIFVLFLRVSGADEACLHSDSLRHHALPRSFTQAQLPGLTPPLQTRLLPASSRSPHGKSHVTNICPIVLLFRSTASQATNGDAVPDTETPTNLGTRTRASRGIPSPLTARRPTGATGTGRYRNRADIESGQSHRGSERQRGAPNQTTKGMRREVALSPASVASAPTSISSGLLPSPTEPVSSGAENHGT